MKILKKNQLAILVIALMLVTAGYLNYTATGETAQTTANTVGDKQLAAIGDATLVNSGELLEEKDKQNIIETINKANEEQESEKNKQENNAIQENVVDTDTNTIDEQNTINTTTVPTNTDANSYFSTSKLEREKMYSQMLQSYQKILENTNISAEQKAISQQEVSKINDTKNAIMIAENLLSTKGFTNSVIFVNDASVSIVVEADTLSTEQIAQIQNIISRELKAEIENIHISNK